MSIRVRLTLAEGHKVPSTPLTRLAVEPGLTIVAAMQSFHRLAATSH